MQDEPLVQVEFGLAVQALGELAAGAELVQYALAAVVWGVENDYLGFAAEGRRAFQRLKETLT